MNLKIAYGESNFKKIMTEGFVYSARLFAIAQHFSTQKLERLADRD